MRANSLVRTRENATMLFAAVSMSLASVFALRAGFQSCSLYPVETIAPPRMEVRGVEPLSKISVAPPTWLLLSHPSGLGVRNTLPAMVVPTPPLRT